MTSTRNIYLKMKTLEQARDILFKAFPGFGTLDTEMVTADQAVGRVLAEPVFAKISSPGFHSAAMDGIAVKAEATYGACETSPKKLILNKDAFYVNTGHVLPQGTDAVIMMEHINIQDENIAEIEAPAFPWQYIRKMGEDIVATELLFPRNHMISPYCTGALIGGGVFSVPVRKKPEVMLIPTGSELLDWKKINIENMKPGQVLESNSYVLGNMIEACGGKYARHGLMPDNPEKIIKAVEDAVNNDFDIVLTVGGSSAGSEDYTKEVIKSLGEILVHGVTIMPGKPVIIGMVKGKPVIGMPGYPVSMIVAFEQFVMPLICRLLGRPEPEREKVLVDVTRKIPSKLGIEEFLRVKLGKVGNRITASSLPRGAGSITTITDADGIIRIPANSEGIKENETVTAELFKPLNAVHNTIVIVGSHDNTLDILADQLKIENSGITLCSSHVGSMGGLMAIKRGVCHVAGSHLLDTENGSYNISYIKRFLPDIKVKIVNLVFRDQGLIIPKGNPKNIHGIEDLARKDIKFINRQSGAGTRILLDYQLNKLNISPEMIQGYGHEEFTHMSVAVAVLNRTADTGLGICAAARALNLEFIPVVTEQYDLIIPEEHFESKNIKILINTIKSMDFQTRVKALGGYHTERTGEIII
ncbi:Molybdopterin molybdenumtransferase [Desulfonema limicola]|uniref:Molybdopterin molybdenumtransferase n=1 Tax=Desulfonema limicola TaxID=45656 RepID=A0A975BCR8_9BACT|nr:molybdopterin biosynthesis protein [Desulfonema limicola]QTA82986.1 Molybdopterin molybdenumtransferase [Desulfonema limicola]